MKELKGIQYLERKPRIQLERNPLIVLIHGYGSNEADLFSFAEDLPDEFHVVSVQGIHALAPDMYAWYEIDFVNMEKFNNVPQGIESRNQLVEFIDGFTTENQLDKENVWLCGFSQGAILSYAIALNFPEKVKHIACLSGYPEPNFIGEFNLELDYSQLDFFISHGVDDMVIPVEWGRKGNPILDELGIKNEYHEYRSGHGIVPQNYWDLMSWMKKS
ncbi:alpha/beta hydrolase [Moheibacter lacus]|uniref:Alpha/beta fold hydrolase n=1 Tax=Moheibacter lacus TaxID=2745851 RepID=A0A838ZSE0_9FLAO|nr:alpha/beta fold hydrolase [Moheibacter lacus]MBA5629559.1 alpha/beta fold hydrolase [Moheibacter lacus]